MVFLTNELFPMNPIYLLADNQEITRLGLKQLLGDVATVVVTDAHSLGVQLEIYPHAVVILDYALFNFESFSQMLCLKKSLPKSSWILFSEELNRTLIREVLLKDETISIVSKSDSVEQITEAIHRATHSQVYLCPLAAEISQSNLSSTSIKELLTPSEKRVLQQISTGKSTKEIANVMHISFHTVNTHRKNIFRKIEVSNIQEAIRYAVRSGLVDYTDYTI
ncbi:MAG: response regulator transcription factor [Phocaeicola sp.]